MYSFLNLLHFLLIIQPLVFALQLLTTNNKTSIPNKILGVSMLVISFFYLINADFLADNFSLIRYKQYFVYGILLGINPFYYLYTKSLTTEDYKFTLKEYYHFAPMLILEILDLLVYLPSKPIILNPLLLNNMAAIAYNIQVLAYSFLMVRFLIKHNVNLKNYFSFDEDINLNWLKIFIVIYISISILDMSIFYSHSESLKLFYYLLMIFFFNFLGYYGIKQREIYTKEKKQSIPTEKNFIEQETVQEKENFVEDNNKINVETKVDKRKQSLMEEINNLMTEDKIFLNTKLTIFDISDKLNVNKTYISNAINEIQQDNFSNYINKFRIEEAKIIILDPKFDNYTFEAIANSVGFNSKASFNSAFKKFTSLTPSVYKKNKLS